MEEKQKYIDEIKKAMRRNRISNEQMAKIAGCSRVNVWRFLEKGLDINWFTFVKIIRYLNLKIE